MLKYESNFQWSICPNKNEIPRDESNILVEMQFSRQSSQRSNKFVSMRKRCVEWRQKSSAPKEAEKLQLADCVFIERQEEQNTFFTTSRMWKGGNSCDKFACAQPGQSVAEAEQKVPVCGEMASAAAQVS